MIKELLTVATPNTLPYRNIAVEKYLLDHVQPGQCILYLWRNANTVVIGRNQSALVECRVADLEADGGHLARRLSGGGAVYHDLGNLNFTFITRPEDFDVDRQNEVILQAVRSLGIPAARTGRNDLEVEEGGKFSGHAYYRSKEACYHHGTLMVQVDIKKMGRYLKPTSEKLASKGVRSVHSRVTNLSTYRPGLSILDMGESLRAAFGSVYGLMVHALDPITFSTRELGELTEHFSSEKWLFRDDRELDHSASQRFDWGGVTLRWEIERGRVSDCLISSDGLDADYLESVPALLRGCEFSPEAVGAALAAGASDEESAAVARDLGRLLFPAGGDAPAAQAE